MVNLIYLVAQIAALVLFVYPFLLYPAILLLITRRKPESTTGGSQLPSVALVICALNEQKVIGKKLENCLALQYPLEKLRTIVISDGSTDRTAEIVRGYEKHGIQLIEQKQRRGKIANLNQVLPSCQEQVLILSDANVLYRSDVLLRLVSRFQDPSVGCVSGKVILTNTTPELDGPTGDYYSLEWLLQEMSSAIYSMVGADGAMYALRRELFLPCPDDTIIEDFVVPMSVVRQGKRVVFEPNAVGWERGAGSIREEFRRKVRIAAGAAQGIVRGNAWPRNAPLRFWFIFLSHKLLRWFSPASGFTVLLLSLFSLGQFLSQILVAGFAVILGLALCRLLTGWSHSILSAPFYFLFGQVALAVGLWKGLKGRQTVLWAKANR